MNNKIIGVIQAGGLGTRMITLTEDKIPKPMLKLNGKPMIEWQFDILKQYGIHDVVLIIGHLGNIIRNLYGDGREYDLSINYIEEKIPLGSAGSLYYLREYPADFYLFIYADVMFDVDINRVLNFHIKKEAKITLVTHPNSHPYDSDLVVSNSDELITGFIWKSEPRTEYYHNSVNSGLAVFSRDVIAEIQAPLKLDWEKEIVSDYIRQNKVYSYHTSEYIKDVGTPERLIKAVYEQKAGKWKARNLANRQKCIFLDRDGTINIKRGFISKPEEISLYDGVSEAIRLINNSGFLAIIVTNQPVVARGMCSEEDVRRINQKIETILGKDGAYVDDIVFCPHHPDKGYPEENPKYKIRCDCRKPGIGMIKQMAEKYNIDLSASYIIGDTTVDIQTGVNAKVNTVLVRTGEAGRDAKYSVSADYVADDLLEAVKIVLSKEGEAMDYIDEIKAYLEEEKKVISSLDLNEINTVMNVLENARFNGNRVFICGNGGSAATASHFASDFNKGVSQGQKIRYDFECLSDNVPMMMAIANDISYEDVFVEPLINKMHKGDLLVGISGSGNSNNVVKAMEYAKSIGSETIGLVGYNGGKIKELSDYCIHVKVDNMQIVEDIHMVMDHVMMYVLTSMQRNK